MIIPICPQLPSVPGLEQHSVLSNTHSLPDILSCNLNLLSCLSHFPHHWDKLPDTHNLEEKFIGSIVGLLKSSKGVEGHREGKKAHVVAARSRVKGGAEEGESHFQVTSPATLHLLPQVSYSTARASPLPKP